MTCAGIVVKDKVELFSDVTRHPASDFSRLSLARIDMITDRQRVI